MPRVVKRWKSTLVESIFHTRETEVCFTPVVLRDGIVVLLRRQTVDLLNERPEGRAEGSKEERLQGDAPACSYVLEASEDEHEKVRQTRTRDRHCAREKWNRRRNDLTLRQHWRG
jgi:hypothetical protein